MTVIRARCCILNKLCSWQSVFQVQDLGEVAEGVQMSDFSLAFADKEITPWSGLALLKQLGDRMGFFENLSHIGLPKPGSNRRYQPEQLITQLLMSVWCSANRFEHCEVTRMDKTLAGIFGINRMAWHRAISRLFSKFDQSLCQSVFDRWYSWMFDNLKVGGLTLVNRSVFTGDSIIWEDGVYGQINAIPKGS